MPYVARDKTDCIKEGIRLTNKLKERKAGNQPGTGNESSPSRGGSGLSSAAGSEDSDRALDCCLVTSDPAQLVVT